MKVTLWYLPSDGGDGSVYVSFFSTEEKMEAYKEAEQNSPYYQGWGEDCSGSVTVDVAEDGTITGSKYSLDPVFGD